VQEPAAQDGAGAQVVQQDHLGLPRDDADELPFALAAPVGQLHHRGLSPERGEAGELGEVGLAGVAALDLAVVGPAGAPDEVQRGRARDRGADEGLDEQRHRVPPRGVVGEVEVEQELPGAADHRGRRGGGADRRPAPVDVPAGLLVVARRRDQASAGQQDGVSGDPAQHRPLTRRGVVDHAPGGQVRQLGVAGRALRPPAKPHVLLDGGGEADRGHRLDPQGARLDQAPAVLAGEEGQRLGGGEQGADLPVGGVVGD